jgi:hypothetical protein
MLPVDVAEVTGRNMTLRSMPYSVQWIISITKVCWMDSVRFFAENLDWVPNYGPEELNVCAVVDWQQTTETNIAALAEKVGLVELEQAVTAAPGHVANAAVSDHSLITESD